MRRNQMGKRSFCSMEEVNKVYFPKSLEPDKNKETNDPASWGVLLARLSIDEVKLLLGDQMDN